MRHVVISTTITIVALSEDMLDHLHVILQGRGHIEPVRRGVSVPIRILFERTVW
jgi:hypothetical protein